MFGPLLKRRIESVMTSSAQNNFQMANSSLALQSLHECIFEAKAFNNS